MCDPEVYRGVLRHYSRDSLLTGFSKRTRADASESLIGMKQIRVDFVFAANRRSDHAGSSLASLPYGRRKSAADSGCIILS